MLFAYGMSDAAENRSDLSAPDSSGEATFSPPPDAEIGTEDSGETGELAEPLALTGDFGDAGDESDAQPEATDTEDAAEDAGEAGDETDEQAGEQTADDADAYESITRDLAELETYRAEKASREQAAKQEAEKQTANLEAPTAASLDQQVKAVEEGVKADLDEWVKVNGFDREIDKAAIAAQEKILRRAANAEIQVAKLRAEIRDERVRAEQREEYTKARTILDAVASELKATDLYGTLGNATPSQTKRAEALLTLAYSLAQTKAAALKAANRPVILDDKAILREAHMTLSKMVGGKAPAKAASKPIATHAPQNGVKGVAKPKAAPKLNNDEAGFLAVKQALAKARKVAG